MQEVGAVISGKMDSKRLLRDGYAGAFVEQAKQLFGRTVEVVKRSDAGRFVVLPKRWIVERTFAWFGIPTTTMKGTSRATLFRENCPLSFSFSPDSVDWT